ncbi:ubiquitin carboxyl-terminal hydrolase 30-like [Saccostrea echinata]|uniref:ubiquitin carboxyl-terminal hydrolase 30-like n=1 Tax=Saccostrea echinata TaxID=191078 RepID=UPI002A8324C5|nr:ubiquitin carboxyl-terminal hydrolase 30-like [Saccostrea echinata]
MDRNFWWIGGITAAVVGGAYALWTSSSGKSNKKKDRCPGLVNLGNTCFLNSVLQGLSSCSHVRNWLSDFVSSGHEKTTSLARTLNDTVRVLNNENEIYDNSHCPVEVISALAARRWYISPEEQDAHEMFHVLTQTIDEETTKYPGVISLFENPETEFQKNEGAMSRIHCPLPVLPHREMEHPFRGLLASQLQCVECGYRNPVRYDHFDSLSLSIPQSIWSDRSLNSLLHHYISADTVNNVECIGCSKIKNRPAGCKAPLKRSTFKKKLTIGKLPQCLAIHIQRCQWMDNGMPVKRHELISYPDILDMSEFVYHKSAAKEAREMGDLSGGGELFHFGMKNEENTFKLGTAPPVNLLRTLNYDNRTTQNGLFLKPQSDTQNSHSDVNHNGPTDLGKSTKASLTYRLSAVIVHLGSVASGHFVTYRRSPNTVKGTYRKERWLCCSDTSVLPMNIADVFSAQAYMLMYERI